jgi:hypothetical protein
MSFHLLKVALTSLLREKRLYDLDEQTPYRLFREVGWRIAGSWRNRLSHDIACFPGRGLSTKRSLSLDAARHHAKPRSKTVYSFIHIVTTHETDPPAHRIDGVRRVRFTSLCEHQASPEAIFTVAPGNAHRRAVPRSNF